MIGAALAVCAVTWSAACARQSAPPGGPEDQRPPVVIATEPAPFDTVTDLSARIRFHFDERISERVAGGALDAAVTISPKAGDLRVAHGRRDLTVTIPDGLRPGIVYRVTLDAVVVDMFGNQLADAFELVFTTGGEVVPTTLAGEVWDRVTGRGMPQMTLHAVGPGGLVHASATTREGIYAFRYLPAGDFTVAAFQDQNRDGELDESEVQGMASAALAPGDTLFLDLAVLTPDTLPAVLMSAEVLDSVTVTVTLDDALEPSQPIDEIAVGLDLEEGDPPAVARVMHEADYVAFVEQVVDSLAVLDSIRGAEVQAAAAAEARRRRALADSLLAAGDSAAADSVLGVVPPPDSTGLPADSVVGDSVAGAAGDDSVVAEPPAGDPPPEDLGVPPADTVVIDPPGDTVVGPRPPTALPPLPGARPGPVEGTDRVLPGRRLVVVLDAPLAFDTEYTVRVSGVTNINGLPGGGGETTLVRPAPPPDTTFIDSLAVPDTGVVQPDTGAVQPDTASVRRLEEAGQARAPAAAGNASGGRGEPGPPGPLTLVELMRRR